MAKYSSKLSVNILTFKTDKRILKNCIDSIDKSISINIIENSKKFQNSSYFKKKKKKFKNFLYW